jgi:hypothetical protein
MLRAARGHVGRERRHEAKRQRHRHKRLRVGDANNIPWSNRIRVCNTCV